MNLDPASVAALIRRLPDADLVRMLDVYTDHERTRAGGVAAAPGEPVAAPAAPVRGPTPRRYPDAPAGDVDAVHAALTEIGPSVKGKLLAETSRDATWIAAGWTDARVLAAVRTGIAGGRIGTEGANKGMRYSAIGAVSPDLAAGPDDGDDDGAPAEVVP